MAFKFVIISCLVALARAGALPAAVVAEPVAVAVPSAIEDFDAFPQYRFGYNVEDSNTGDVKSQFEERNGNLVRGQYSLDEADGTKRIVDYYANDLGFFATVRNTAIASVAAVAAPAPVVETAVVAEPVAARFAAPAAVPAARLVAGPAPVAPAPVSVFAPRYTAAYAPSAPASFARYAYQPFGPVARFAAPFTYPSAPASVVAV